MKFVALALALLLAVGSQAAPMMADAPPVLQKFRDDTDMAMQEVIDMITKALVKVEDSELTAPLTAYLNNFQMKVKTARDQIAPITNSVAESVLEFHAKMAMEMETLREEIKADVEKAKETVKKQYEDYRSKLIPEILQLNDAERESAKADVIEIKEALEPIGQKVYKKIYDGVESVRQSGYFDEYKEQLKVAYEQGQLNREEYLSSLMEKVGPQVENLKNNLHQIFTTVRDTIMKN